MCDFEEFAFTCGHSQFRLKSYCHFARNEPNHQCLGVKKLRHIWDQGDWCQDCIAKMQADQWSSDSSAYAYGECRERVLPREKDRRRS
jgi:hypothetical protein